MNQILLSFLCGAAFIGGAVAVTFLTIVARTFMTRKDRDELYGYWQQSIKFHEKQVAVLERIALKIEDKLGD